MTRAPHFQPVTLNYSSDPFNPDCPGDGCHLLHFRDEQVRSGGRGGRPALMSGLRPRPIASWPDALTLRRPTGSQSRRVNQTSEKGRTQVIPCSLSPLPPHHVPFSVRVSLSSCLPPPLPLLWLVVPCICAPGGRPVGTGFRGETIAVRILNGARTAGARAREAGQGAEAMG